MNMIEQLMRERTAYRALIIGLVRTGGGRMTKISHHCMPQRDEKFLIDVASPDEEGAIIITLREKM